MTCKNNISTVQNLKDSGCNKALIENFMLLESEGKTGKQLLLLAKQRHLLLSLIHKHQKELDCLDYLIFSKKRL